MSVPERRRKSRRPGKSALQIMEEAFHLLRMVDLRYYWIFYAGAVPFVVALLYFSADMSRSSRAGESMLEGALVMTALCLWLRVAQAVFSRGLWRTIQPESRLVERRGEMFRQFAALSFVQAFQVPLLVIGLILALPLGWIVAFLQNATVLSLTRRESSRSLRNLSGSALKYAHDDWAQNHGILFVIALVSFFTWVNLVATCLILASFAKSFLGVESIFTISPMAAILNTTFALGSLLLTYLVISPILKAVYTLRCFYAQSRSSGEDLLSRLASCRAGGAKNRDAGGAVKRVGRAAVIGILFAASFPGSLCAETELPGGGGAETDTTARQLERSIGETMAQRKYQWQLSRRLQEVSAEEMERSWLAAQLYELGGAIRDLAKDFAEWVEKLFQRLEPPKVRTRDNTDASGFFEGISSVLSIGLILLVAALGAWLALLIYRKYRGGGSKEEGDTAVTEIVDLRSEDIVASQLPEDEWLRLAREQMEKGDRRLAVRALFLASLAKLGDEELIRIARFKSNRDYRRELSRKARGWEALNDAFAANIQLFERAWYGWHEVGEDTVEEFLNNHEGIVSLSVKAGRRRFLSAGGPVAALSPD